MIRKSTSHISFRYDINALRAIAILGVIFFHYKIDILSGGFAGVDIFFVISGYLMSKIILKSINKNEFSFQDYLGKRLKRIVPAFLFLILILSLICFFIYLPEDYKLSQKNAAGSILFLSNILYWLNAGSYFSPVSDTNILLHSWSLSVEWQFYLIYPFFLLALNKIFKSRILYLSSFIGLTIILFFVSTYLTNIKPTASFYLLPTRSWEMLMGGIAFFSEDIVKQQKWRKPLAILGYISILICLMFLKVTMPWPGFYTLFPVLATFVVIIANYNDFKVIRHVSIQFIGRISYSLYLWHWPIYIIAQYFGIKATWQTAIMFSALSVLLAYLSFRYIEAMKINRSKMIIAAMITVFVSTAALSYFDSNSIIFKPVTLQIAEYSNIHQKDIDRQFSRGICFAEPGDEVFKKEECLCFNKDKKNILLLGDSHAAQLSESLRERFAKQNINLLQATVGGVFPSVKKTDDKEPKLREILDFVYQKFIPQNAKKIDAVIITAHWALHKNMQQEDVLANLKEVIQYFKKYNIKVVIIGQIESYIISYQTMAAKDYEYNLSPNRGYLDDNSFMIDDYLRKKLGSDYVRVINTKTFPPLSTTNDPYMWDRNHVTKYGADLIVDKVFSTVSLFKAEELISNDSTVYLPDYVQR